MAVVFHYIPSTDEYELTGAPVSPLHLRNRGEILLGPNPPYPVAKAGDFWTCRQQGRVGGSGGKLLGVGDAIVALYASTGGLEAVVGTLWLRLGSAPVSLESNPDDSSSVTFPVNTTAPVLSGTGVEGDVLSTTTGVWDNSPTSYAYQWVRNSVDIVGETGGMYTPVNGDIGTTIYARVTATNGDGSDSANSNSIVITAIVPPAEAQARYYGVNASATLDNTAVLSLGNDTATVKGKSATLSPSTQYVYYLYPAEFGNLTGIYIDDAGHAFNQLSLFTKTTQSVTPSGGSAASYNVYKSTAQLDTISSVFEFV